MAMIRLTAILALPLLAVGCAEPGERAATGDCPAGETCSDDTPNGLYFLGTPLVGVLTGGPETTAIGGTQEITVETEQSTLGDYDPLTLPFVADDDGGLGVKVIDHTGAVVSVQGVATRSNYLRILSASTGELYDRVMLDGAAIDDIVLTGASYESTPPDLEQVWYIGTQSVGIALVGFVQGNSGPELQRLVDTSMQIDAAGSTRPAWDTLHFANAQVGVTTVSVAAGGAAPRDLSLEFVDHADAIALTENDDGIQTVTAGHTGIVCFSATNAGRFIHGLTWTFTIDGLSETHPQTQTISNCLVVDATMKQPLDVIAITASAGGKTSTLDVHVVEEPGARKAPAHHWHAIEGERARALTK
jgi:hypothetical protein